jgi:hypothetical protein
MVRRSAVVAGLIGWAVQALAVSPGYSGLMIDFDGQGMAPVVAVSGKGDLALAWVGDAADGTTDVFFRAYRAGVTGETTRANTTTAGDQTHAALAMGPAGNSVVVWQSGGAVFGQRFTASGQPAGSEFQVADPGGASDSEPDVAMDGFGNYVLAWKRTSGSTQTILARRFMADGTPVADPFEVAASQSPDVLRDPALAVGAWGEFVVAWTVERAGSEPDVYASSFAADGTPDGAAWAVATLPAQARRAPDVGMDANGHFVVAWTDLALDGTTSIQARQFGAGGVPLGGQIRVNVEEVGAASEPRVAMGALGDFVVAWDAVGDSSVAWAKRQFAPDGSRVGPETGGMQYPGSRPAVAMDVDGDAYVVARGWGATPHWVKGFAGPLDIDLELSVEETADPVVPGDPVEHVVTIRNRHAGDTVTGIAELDAGIGALFGAHYYIYFEGPSLSALPPPAGCKVLYSVAPYYQCGLLALLPGESITSAFQVVASEPGIVTSSAAGFSGQHDSQPGNDSGGQVTTVACAEGDGVGSVVIAEAPQEIIEGEQGVVTLERVGGTCGALRAHYYTNSFPLDFESVYGEVHWAAGEAGTRSIVIRTYEDDIDEDTYVIVFNSQAWGSSGAVGALAEARINLTDDDDEPTITITPAPGELTVTEAAGTLTYTLTLSHPSERGVTVPVSFGGTADAGDYSVTPGGVISFYSTLEQKLRVTIRENQVHEGEETLIVSFGPAARATIVGPTTATLTIQDNDPPPVVSIITADWTRAEGESLFVHVRVWPQSSLPVTVPLNWSGDAVHGVDFTAPTSVVIPAGETFAVITVTTLRDGLDENLERAILSLGTPVNATLGEDTSLILSITDMDPTPTLTLLAAPQVVREGSGVQVPITVELSAASGLEVRAVLSPSGSATRGQDYSVPNDLIVIPAGSTRATKTVQILNDGVIEMDEQVTFTLGSLSNATAGAVTKHTLTIEDNDPEFLDLRETLQGAGGH